MFGLTVNGVTLKGITLKDFYDLTVVDYENYYVNIVDTNNDIGVLVFCDETFVHVINNTHFSSLRVSSINIDCECLFIALK